MKIQAHSKQKETIELVWNTSKESAIHFTG